MRAVVPTSSESCLFHERLVAGALDIMPIKVYQVVVAPPQFVAACGSHFALSIRAFDTLEFVFVIVVIARLELE